MVSSSSSSASTVPITSNSSTSTITVATSTNIVSTAATTTTTTTTTTSSGSNTSSSTSNNHNISSNNTTTTVTKNTYSINSKGIAAVRLCSLDNFKMLASHDSYFNVPFLTSTAATRPIHARNVLQPGIDPGFQPMKNKTGPRSHKGASNNIQRKKIRLENTTNIDDDAIPTRGLDLTPSQQTYLLQIACDSANFNKKKQKDWNKILTLFQNKFPLVNIQNSQQLKNHCNYIIKLPSTSLQMSGISTASSSSFIVNTASVEEVINEYENNEFIHSSNSSSSSAISSTGISSLLALTNLELPSSSDPILTVDSNMNTNNSNNENSNNKTYSSADLARVQLQTDSKRVTFSETENAIFNSLLSSHGSKSGSINWSHFQNAFIEKCKTAKLNDSQVVVYHRTTEQLKQRSKTMKDKVKPITSRPSTDNSRNINEFFSK